MDNNARKILVVEDEPNVRNFVKVYLEFEGYKVIEAGNGKEGLKRVDEEKPDLIVTDIMMPEMDGVQFYLNLRQKPETKQIPVIVLTVKDEFEDIKYAYLIGVDEYVTKPFDPQQLVSKIKEILS
ncbi:MAG: response regulator [Armatimonadetes bacterium]|nr:response regulator [Armatimonadota bacterium]